MHANNSKLLNAHIRYSMILLTILLIFKIFALQAEVVMGQNRQYTMMVQMLNDFRGYLGTLTIYNDINIPLVYTQVVVIAVYAFFLAEIFTSQQLNPTQEDRKFFLKVINLFWLQVIPSCKGSLFPTILMYMNNERICLQYDDLESFRSKVHNLHVQYALLLMTCSVWIVSITCWLIERVRH